MIFMGANDFLTHLFITKCVRKSSNCLERKIKRDLHISPSTVQNILARHLEERVQLLVQTLWFIQRLCINSCYNQMDKRLLWETFVRYKNQGTSGLNLNYYDMSASFQLFDQNTAPVSSPHPLGNQLSQRLSNSYTFPIAAVPVLVRSQCSISNQFSVAKELFSVRKTT